MKTLATKSIYMKSSYIPNLLTTLRISLIPIFVFAFYYSSKWTFLYTTAIFAFAAITDWLDGYLARKLGHTSNIGAFLDPVADKLIVVVALILLTEAHNTLIMSIPAAVIVCREIIISSLREWMACCDKSATVAVSLLGKIKTTTQMIAILLLLFKAPQLTNITMFLGYVFLYISMFLTVWSMWIYLKAAFQVDTSNLS